MQSTLLYVATGPRYFDEAVSNAHISSRYLHPNSSILISTDCSVSNIDCGFPVSRNIQQPVYSYRDKILGLAQCTSSHILFLDSDACLVYDSTDLFKLLDIFDLCATQAPVRHPPGWSDSSVPLSFPEYNTGVLLFKNTSLVRSMFQSWLKLYDKLINSCNQSWDQASFRSVLFDYISNNGLKFACLPPECNLRTTKPWIVGRGLPAYVIHGRYHPEEFNSFTSYLNDDIDCFRTYAKWLERFPSSSIRPRFDRTFN